MRKLLVVMIESFNLTAPSFLKSICITFWQCAEKDQTSTSVNIAVLGHGSYNVRFVDETLSIGHRKFFYDFLLPRRLVNEVGSLLHQNHWLLDLSNAFLMDLSFSTEVRRVHFWRGITLKRADDFHVKILHIFLHH